MSTPNKYFISYVMDYKISVGPHAIISYGNIIIDIHPFEWLSQTRKRSGPSEVTLLHYQPITLADEPFVDLL